MSSPLKNGKPPFKMGERVRFTFYGKVKTGTVSRNQASEVVFIDTPDGRRHWQHASDVERAVVTAGIYRDTSKEYSNGND